MVFPEGENILNIKGLTIAKLLFFSENIISLLKEIIYLEIFLDP